jgi:hypothetical protein
MDQSESERFKDENLEFHRRQGRRRVTAADDNDARVIGRRENRPGFTGLLRAIVQAEVQAPSKEPKL